MRSIIHTQVNVLTREQMGSQKQKRTLSGSDYPATLYIQIYLMRMWLEKPNVKHAGQPINVVYVSQSGRKPAIFKTGIYKYSQM